MSPRLASLQGALAETGDGRVVDRFWSDVMSLGTPLVERIGPGECAVTFLWRDPSPAARPHVLANKLHDRADPAGSAMTQVPGTDVWYLTYALPSDWRGSYHIGVGPGRAPDPGPPMDGRVRPHDGVGAPRRDPHCRLALSAAAGAKSIAELPDAPPQRFLHPRSDVSPGSVSERLAAGPDGPLQLWIYEPAVEHDQQLPLLVVLDGEMWSSELGLATTLDNLIGTGAIRPVRAVLVGCGTDGARARRLIGNDEFAAWLANGLPASLGHDGPATLAGQSLGGLAALHTALHYPQRYPAVVAQSASLWSDAAHALAPRAGLRVYMEVGSDEWINVAPNTEFADRLAAAGSDVVFHTYRGGHDRACWRGGIADGLVAVSGSA